MAGLQDIIGGSILDGFAKIVSLFKVPPEVALQHQAEIAKIAADQQLAILNAANVEIQAASDNIKAEEASGDKYTSRARPSFMYLCIFVLGMNYVVFPCFNRPAVNFPEPLFWLFGSCILGYTGARSWEKFAGPKDK